MELQIQNSWGRLGSFPWSSLIDRGFQVLIQGLTEISLHPYGPSSLQVTFSELVLLSNVHHSVTSNFLGHNQLPNTGCVNLFYHLGSIFLHSCVKNVTIHLWNEIKWKKIEIYGSREEEKSAYLPQNNDTLTWSPTNYQHWHFMFKISCMLRCILIFIASEWQRV